MFNCIDLSSVIADYWTLNNTKASVFVRVRLRDLHLINNAFLWSLEEFLFNSRFLQKVSFVKSLY